MADAPGSVADIPIVDTDSHICEPPDLWTSRLSQARWGDLIPHVEFDERVGRDRWVIGGSKLTSVANYAIAGWREHPPSHPPTLAEADPGAFEAKPRLARMDEYGIYAQTLYPNLLAFSHH
ncbi:MAG TPA: amidohydrolase, partial [Acidimicrobiia bacterium]|nr:amidohydrolase [Acidimicrobiia bacterium]